MAFGVERVLFKQLYLNYVVPAAIFQSVIIGGGYGTGREIMEFVTRHGVVGGLLACLTIGIVFSAVLALSFAFAHHFRVYNYRNFLQALLGRCWLAYELLFVLLLVLVLAIVSAAAGRVIEDNWQISPTITTASLLVLVVAINYLGRGWVERLASAWTLLLMAALVTFAVSVFSATDVALAMDFNQPLPLADALISGLQFAAYNSALIPVLVYCTADLNSTAVAAKAGLVAGLLGALPAMIIHLTLVSFQLPLLDQALPIVWVMQRLDLAALLGPYYVILCGTLVLTAVGVLQGVNERIDGWRTEQGKTALSRRGRGLIAGALVATSLLLAQIGIIDLVAKGYGALSWGFLCVFTLPLLSLGTFKLYRHGALRHGA